MGVDLVVVGAGHAGCEAAAAAARMGLRVTVVTLDRRRVGEMPCNPAVGGIGKGHLVAEIDALGGVQGWAADRAGIHFRLLNRSRGPAVWGPRAQSDKALYALVLRRLLDGLAGVAVVEGEVVGLGVRGDRITGVILAGGAEIRSRAVLVTSGTFLSGLMHVGSEQTPGGRFGEGQSSRLGEQLSALGFALRRFKTGTPPRVHRDSIDFGKLQEQPGDEDPKPFSWRTRRVVNRSLCWLTRTTETAQQLIGDNLHRSPLFSGAIEGVGPRYCPSIEDKVVRFPHHREHTVFVEPEGLSTPSMYLNGLSTSLPRDVQESVVRSVPGLERAHFLRHGYAVEYDVVAPGQVERTLASRSVRGLSFAGQVLGTSGYEEAAAQGLLAGINVARELREEAPWVPGRESSYLGVLVDDLVGREHREPYRMFTSRAEHRLLLGVDSARERLMAIGVELGLVPERAFHVERERWEGQRRAAEVLRETGLRPDRETRAWLLGQLGLELRTPTSWAQLLARPGVDWEAAAAMVPVLAELSPADREVVRGRLCYDGYRSRLERERLRVERLREVEIPAGFDFRAVPGLSREVVEALERARPRTLADAEGLAAATPAAVAVLAGRLSAAGDGRGVR